MEQILLNINPFTLLAIALWSLPWKAWALWLSARRGDLKWFLAMVILNTVGILEIIYIFFIAKQSEKNTNNE